MQCVYNGTQHFNRENLCVPEWSIIWAGKSYRLDFERSDIWEQAVQKEEKEHALQRPGLWLYQSKDHGVKEDGRLHE